MTLLYVALGGALGAVARYGLSGWLQETAGGTFPWGTLAVNVAGCFLLGLTLAWLERVAVAADVRSFAAIGVLGAFTTFSTFSYEAVALLRDRDWLRAGGYLSGSLLLGLAAVVAGLGLGALLIQARS